MQAQANLTSFVTFNPITVLAESDIVEVIQLLADTGTHHWPVIDDERRLKGIFSERDLVRALPSRAAELGSPSSLTSLPTPSLAVADWMTDVVASVTPESSPRQVLRTLLDIDVDWLPVLEDEMVVGVTTYSDFLREFSYGQLGISKTQVADVMDPAEAICGEASLSEAWDALLEQPSDCLGVVRGDFPLGVLSQRDLRLAMCRVAVSDWLEDHRVDYDLKISGPRTVLELVAAAPTIRPGARLQDAATLMLDHNRQAIAVVNQANRMMGTVTEKGILSRMYSYLI